MDGRIGHTLKKIGPSGQKSHMVQSCLAWCRASMQFPTFSLPSKMDGRRLCLTLLCLISSNPILGLDAEDKCVPIPQCKTLHWMWRHRTEFPSKSPEEVEKFIFSLRCGMDLCPKEQKVRSVRDRNPLIHRRKSPLKRKYEDNIQRACQPHLK